MGNAPSPHPWRGHSHDHDYGRRIINLRNWPFVTGFRIIRITSSFVVLLLFLFCLSYKQSAIPIWPRPLLETPNSKHPFGPLRFHKDGTFHVSIFEDLHFGENAWETWGPQQDKASIRVISTILDAEPSTSLVVLNGDLVTGENTFLHNSTHYLDQIVSPMVDRNLTWASTYGNHDSDFNLSRSALFSREKRYPNSRTTQMVSSLNDEAGITNYFLPVYPSSCPSSAGARGSGTPSKPSCVPLLVLYFFDSRGGFRFQEPDRRGQENWVHPSVASWFKRATSSSSSSTALFPRGTPSLAFVHIPPNATRGLQESGIHPHRHPGINQDVPASRQAQGWCEDGGQLELRGAGCSYGGQDAPFMQALQETPGLLAVFFGHDHGNTWCKNWGVNNTVRLCYGQRTGYGGYGNWVRGARQVVVSVEGLRERELDTWIRLETGKAVARMRLNESYGEDWYEKVEDERTCLGCG
ncbi:hypothetical protein QBC42DRAFT_265528 [Cladorrhinum samala]|uniref:Calcineurin-like phosphoesterase domain-containing protein n=1 Tax=Cladorrhinum samala TaxID=585594 RepID=A0AAV9HRU5_9PEZI|nr:hypothetical protein QBC42DRAFT_265528 [Cladorrhinum samala]